MWVGALGWGRIVRPALFLLLNMHGVGLGVVGVQCPCLWDDSPRLGSRWVSLPHAQLSVCARNLVPSGRPLRSWPSSPMLPKVLLAGDVLGAYTWAGVQPAGLGGLLLALQENYPRH